MKRWVVDTNVPVVANGRHDGANGGAKPSRACRLAAIDFLDTLLKSGRVVLDAAGEVQAEYRRYLSPRGQPGVGDRFYLAILQSAPERVERIDVPKAADGSFTDFPSDPALARFDVSDRKFAALSIGGLVPVAVATDSDWANAHADLSRNGVQIRFLCGCDPTKWFER